MRKIVLLVLVFTMVLAGCSTSSNNEVIKGQEQVVEQEGTEVVDEIVDEIEELEEEIIEEEVIELEEVEEVEQEVIEEQETAVTIEKFKGEYIEEETNIVVIIEDDRFILGYYASEGIIIENPVYTFESDNILTVEGLALDGFDHTEYETMYKVELVDENNIIFLGDSVSYKLTRM